MKRLAWLSHVTQQIQQLRHGEHMLIASPDVHSAARCAEELRAAIEVSKGHVSFSPFIDHGWGKGLPPLTPCEKISKKVRGSTEKAE